MSKLENKGVLLNRVPQIIFIYWVIKIASTTLGETGADMFSMTFHIGYSITILIFMTIFFILLGIKISIKKYEPILYWLVFTSTAIVGTAISDFIDRTLELGYIVGTLSLIGVLIAILFIWYRIEKDISVEEIRTTNAEVFYWMAFLAANTLGTAMGDLLADELGIGFLNSALIISVILTGIVFLHFYTKVSRVFLFWFAFVLTRPFGATFGDLLTKSVEQGGLDFGTVGSSVFFFVILIVAVLKESNLEKSRLNR